MSEDLHLSHKLDYPAVPFAAEENVLLLASLAAPQISGQSDRSSVDLVAVLDRCAVSRANMLKRLLYSL